MTDADIDLVLYMMKDIFDFSTDLLYKKNSCSYRILINKFNDLSNITQIVRSL
jgi:hypothetical protein